MIKSQFCNFALFSRHLNLLTVHSESELCNRLAQVPVYLSRNTAYFDRHLVIYAVISRQFRLSVLKRFRFNPTSHFCVCVQQMESCQRAVIGRWLNVGVCVGGITACTNTRMTGSKHTDAFTPSGWNLWDVGFFCMFFFSQSSISCKC